MPLRDDDIKSFAIFCANGDGEAADFLVNIASCARLADDIADGDSNVPVEHMWNLLHRAFVNHPNNSFFLNNRSALSVAISNAVNAWRKSEEWRNSDNRKTRIFGFVYRESIEHVAHSVAVLTGGANHALNVMQVLHEKSHQSSDETLEDWEAEGN